MKLKKRMTLKGKKPKVEEEENIPLEQAIEQGIEFLEKGFEF